MKKLLIVVDYQNDFVEGSLGFNEAKKIENNIIEKINLYHQKKDEVIFTLDTHFKDYLDTNEGKHLPVKHCIKGSYGHQLTDALLNVKQTQDVVFEKNTFPSLDLANYLVNKQYESVELCGIVSNICVISNAIMVKSALPNTMIFVDEKAIASSNDDLHHKAIDILKNLHIEVIK